MQPFLEVSKFNRDNSVRWVEVEYNMDALRHALGIFNLLKQTLPAWITCEHPKTVKEGNYQALKSLDEVRSKEIAEISNILDPEALKELYHECDELSQILLDLKAFIYSKIPNDFTLEDEDKLDEKGQQTMLDAITSIQRRAGEFNEKMYALNESIHAHGHFIERKQPFARFRGDLVPPALINMMKRRFDKIQEGFFAIGEKSEYIRLLLGVPEDDKDSTPRLK